MLCPSCQKKLTKLLHEKLTKSRSAVERIRICSCGYAKQRSVIDKL